MYELNPHNQQVLQTTYVATNLKRYMYFRVKLLIPIITLLFSSNIHANTKCELPNEAKVAIPVIKFEAGYENKTGKKLCSIISYKLKAKPNSNGVMLTPTLIKIEYTNDEAYGNNTKSIFSKWKFLSRKNSTEVVYYQMFKK